MLNVREPVHKACNYDYESNMKTRRLIALKSLDDRITYQPAGNGDSRHSSTREKGDSLFFFQSDVCNK